MNAKTLVNKIFEEYDPAAAGERAGKTENSLRGMSVKELLAYKEKHEKTWEPSTERMWKSIYREAKKA